MPRSTAHDPSRAKCRDVRARLRARGLRPIEIWVPDVHAPGFREEAHRQSLAVARSPYEPDDQAFVDAVSGRGESDAGP
jgi:hypothetical protein